MNQTLHLQPAETNGSGNRQHLLYTTLALSSLQLPPNGGGSRTTDGTRPLIDHRKVKRIVTLDGFDGNNVFQDDLGALENSTDPSLRC
ncbi:hypothetical protein PROFUN_07731 [Planoprotostelium fungivorum]|uniref:Uncharacterized protein n=1 Tax=Planoprotostelium fungivorum TaxID=1890364 RepID=A0A2P6N1G9_9EUKA|nr:hypothetical protein PROFUN_07731 [Planoprotostelium fungivorum]